MYSGQRFAISRFLVVSLVKPTLRQLIRSSTSAPHLPIIQLKLVQEVEVEWLQQHSEFYVGGLLEKGLFGNWRLWCYFPEAGEWSQHFTQLQSVGNTTDSSRVGWSNTKDKSRVGGDRAHFSALGKGQNTPDKEHEREDSGVRGLMSGEVWCQGLMSGEVWCQGFAVR